MCCLKNIFVLIGVLLILNCLNYETRLNQATGISMIEVITDKQGNPIDQFNLDGRLFINTTDIDKIAENIIFNQTEINDIQNLKEKLHTEEEYAKLQESGKKCFYGLNCLYGLNSMDGLINKEKFKQSQSSSINQTIIDNDQFNRYLGDENMYRFFKLDNGLKVFLVSNNLLYTSSLSLGIEVGSANDPEGIDGVSYLLTQELFKKESNVTNETDFRKLLDDNNGYFNVESNKFSTIYSYDIKSKYFQLSVNAFKKRLEKVITWSSLDESISEVAKLTELFKNVYTLQEIQLKRSLSNSSHIFSRFPYGTNETLREIPSKNNLSLQEEIIKFKKNYYSPHLMVLSISTSLSLDTTEELVRNTFSDLINTGIYPEKPEELSGNVTHPYDTLIGKYIEVKSPTPEAYITMEFPIPNQSKLWRYKLGSYAKYFLTQRFQNGFLDKMTKQGWIREIEVDVINNDTGFSNLVIKAILVDSDRNKLLRVVQAIFATLDAVKTAKYNKHLDEQIRRVEQGILKQYKSTGYYRYSKNIVKSFLESGCSPENILLVPYELEVIDHSYVRMILEYLNPFNMVLTFSSNSFSRNSKDFLLSSEIYGESGWGRFSRKFVSFLRTIRRTFLRAKPGEYPNFMIEKYLNANYLITDIPTKILDILEGSTQELAFEYLGFNITEIVINYPKQYKIYTYDIPPQVHPQLLVESLASYIKYTSNTTEDIDEALMNKVLSGFNEFVSPIAYSTFYFPINVGVPKISLNSRIIIQPKSLVVYGFQSLPKTNAKLVTLSYLFMKSFKYATPPEYRDCIVENSYKSISELQNSFLGIEFRWTNYTSSFDDFFSTVFNGLRKYNSYINKNHFDRAKSDFESIINNISSLNSKTLAEYTSFETLNFYMMTPSMFIQAIKSVKFKDVVDFASYIIKMGTIESLVIGNCTPMQVNSYLLKIGRILNRDLVNTSDLTHLRLLNNSTRIITGWDTNHTEYSNFNLQDSPKSSITSNQRSELNNNTIVDSQNYLGNYSSTNITRKVTIVESSEKTFLTEGYYKGKWTNRINMDTLPKEYKNIFYLKKCSNSNEDLSVVYMEIQVGEYSEEMFAFLKLVVNLDIQSSFKQFTSSDYPNTVFEILPYSIGTSYLLLKIMISSAEYSIIKLTSLAVQFYNKYFALVTPLISRDEFKKGINRAVTSIEIPHINMEELLDQYSSSLLDRKSDPNWKYIQVAYLLNLNYNEFLNKWGVFVKPAKVLISILKTHVSAIEIAEANSFQLEGYNRINSTSIVKKAAIENNFISY
ncbi:secreted insulinase-like peptidase [Cryptosporidium ubiquitum]|uniref:Secreted insulinase-like peptidase n=1 Tax=Cryptosporidium ubiquitum TaxID=857276 RepID=A0A1J4MK37_9CRYT|nr:secreted insulinase-like peptidase [Cryptosporidium ubiquitum]OII74383.1 secreted insulinase-like peptidase [Cryptosporidium ubiquitum]